MAGIGFELKKLYKEGGGIARTVGAMGYSTFTTIGPTLMVVGALVGANLLMTRWGISEQEKMLFAGVTLYCFIIALVVSSIFDTVISRYVSDCIFSGNEERIRPAIQGSTMMFAGIFSLLGLTLALILYLVSGIDAYYALMVYFLLMGVGLVFGLSVFVTAIKAYRRVTIAYLIGTGVILLVGAVCRFGFGLAVGHSVLTGFAAGFLTIAIQLFLFLHMAFPEGDKSYFGFFESVKKNKLLLISGLFYVLGLYVHNMVFWTNSELQVVVAKVLYYAPAYDMASFVAMLTSITAVVIFVVRVETSFYREYKGYCEAVIGQNLGSIRLSREKMMRTLINEVYFVGEFQLIITIILMILCMTFLPVIGIAGLTLDIYPTLALGYYTVFMMHLLMIFLYYFDDQAGAAVVGVSFFVLTLAATLVTRQLGISYYGLGLIISGLFSWIAAFFRLRKILRQVDYRMFCDNVRVRISDEVS